VAGIANVHGGIGAEFNSWSIPVIPAISLDVTAHNPDLSLHGVLAGAVERFDAQVLFDRKKVKFWTPVGPWNWGEPLDGTNYWGTLGSPKIQDARSVNTRALLSVLTRTNLRRT
jgi:hypothetical protein